MSDTVLARGCSFCLGKSSGAVYFLPVSFPDVLAGVETGTLGPNLRGVAWRGSLGVYGTLLRAGRADPLGLKDRCVDLDWVVVGTGGTVSPRATRFCLMSSKTERHLYQ